MLCQATSPADVSGSADQRAIRSVGLVETTHGRGVEGRLRPTQAVAATVQNYRNLSSFAVDNATRAAPVRNYYPCDFDLCTASSRAATGL